MVVVLLFRWYRISGYCGQFWIVLRSLATIFFRNCFIYAPFSDSAAGVWALCLGKCYGDSLQCLDTVLSAKDLENISSNGLSCKKLLQKLWCLCRQPDDGHFMICCNRCNEWYHGDCVVITSDIGYQMEEDAKEFICPMCELMHGLLVE